MHWSRVLQLHVRIVESQSRELCVHHDCARLAQISFQPNLALCASMAAEMPKMQVSHQEWIEVNVADVRLPLNRIRRHQSNRVSTRDASVRHRGTQRYLCLAAVRGQRSIKTPDGLLANSQIHNAN